MTEKRLFAVLYKRNKASRTPTLPVELVCLKIKTQVRDDRPRERHHSQMRRTVLTLKRLDQHSANGINLLWSRTENVVASVWAFQWYERSSAQIGRLSAFAALVELIGLAFREPKGTHTTNGIEGVMFFNLVCMPSSEIENIGTFLPSHEEEKNEWAAAAVINGDLVSRRDFLDAVVLERGASLGGMLRHAFPLSLSGIWPR